MPIQNMPTALQPIIQQGFLEREFHDGLTSALGYRAVADREPVAINVGETVTKTRTGLKAPVTTPLTASSNTNLDNGLTPSAFTVEQYTLGINQYADTIDLNVITSQVGIANQFLKNAQTNGIQARQSLDRIARNALFNAYMGGQTRVRTTLGAPAATINVDDVRGFATVLVNGQFVPVSGTNTAQVLIGSNVYTLTGVAVDGSNVSSVAAFGGTSGTLTFSGNVTVADGTALNAVIHLNAPALVRPNGKWYGGSAQGSTTATSALTSSDVLTLGTIEDAVATLRNNTGMQDEMFNFYLDNVSMRQLFADQDFKLMYQGQYGSPEARQGKVFQLMGVNFIPTTEALVQAAGSNVPVRTRRPILCAPGALVEGDFAGMEQKAHETWGINSEVQVVDGVVQVTRGPLDRLQQIVAQSWFWIGGFVAPTDATANQTIIPTAGSQYLKRAVVIEHAG
ncbi:hypothetical protein [Aquitalea magnusonii]|uniref:DUF4043 domain-containing protein n=1 Tax=Aquitalea magnusonii TaxID=332411 RepID=A0A318J4B7_9NEIS|nr:hypothetical protein [Aquitalea magnusonii]PXX42222.1 hypothetical protein DFR38_12019 [Aquitalea magnusonii]